MRTSPFLVPILVGLFAVANPAKSAVFPVPSTEYPTIASGIASASAGDTVLIAPGDYPRVIAVTKAVLLLAEDGDEVRVAGLNGSAAQAEGLVFSAELLPQTSPLVTAGDGLRLARCRFEGAVQGILVEGAALTVENCSFADQIQAVSVGEAGHDISLRGCTFKDCPLVFVAESEPTCSDGERREADPCPGASCRTALLETCTIQGGDNPIRIGGCWDLQILGCTFQAVDNAVSAWGSRVRIENTSIIGHGSIGIGLELIGCSGHVRRSGFSGFEVGVLVGDGGCPVFTNVVIGGSLNRGNTMSGRVAALSVEQPESVIADFNHWGSLDCDEAQAKIQGQPVGIIADVLFLQTESCVVPAHPTTWGRLKLRGTGP